MKETGSGSLRARSAAGVVWTAAQIWTVRSLNAASFVVVGRQLEPSAFGLVALAAGIIAVLSIISDSGLATYIMRQRELDDRTKDTAFWTSLALACILAVVLAVSAGPLAEAFGEPGLSAVLLVLTSVLVLAGLNSLPNALMRRDLRFRALAGRGTAATLVSTFVAIVLALSGAGVWTLVAQSVTGALVGTVMLWRAIDWRPRFRFNLKQARSMLAFGSKLLSIDLMMQARDRGEEFVLAGVASTTTLGYWSVTTKLVKLIQDTGSQVISTVATPTFSKLQDDLPRLYRAYETSMAATGVVIFPAMLFLAATSPDLVPFVLGDQWSQTGSIAQVAALTAAVGVFSFFDRTMFVAVNRLRPEMILVAFIISMHLIIVVFAAGQGLMVLALGLLVRALLTFPIRQVVLHRVVGVPYRSLIRPLRVFGAAAVMAGLVLAASHLITVEERWLRLVTSGIVAVITYPASLMLIARPVALEFLVEAGSLVRGRRSRRKAAAVQADEQAILAEQAGSSNASGATSSANQ